MPDNMKRFLEAASADGELAQKISGMGREEIIDAAKALGIALTGADFDPFCGELDDDELDAVAGGGDVSCACANGGAGTKDSNDKTCGCVAAGAGYSKAGRERCVCGFAGFGYDT